MPNARPTLAVNMIARDEAPRIGVALDSARDLCNEMIVVVDSRTTDDTADVARAHGATVVVHEWSADRPSYADARNVAIDATRSDWILVLDADDVIEDDARAKIAALMADAAALAALDGVFCQYDYERSAGGAHQRFPINRLFRRDPSIRWTGCVHETVAFPDATRVMLRDDITITHRHDVKDRTDRTQQLHILECALASGDTSERVHFYYANELRNARRFAESLEHYLSYARRPDSLAWQRYYAMAVASALAWEAGDATNARRYAAQAILIDPSRAEAYCQLGEIELAADNPRGALPMYHAALASTAPVGGFVTHEAYDAIPRERIDRCRAMLATADADATVDAVAAATI